LKKYEMIFSFGYLSCLKHFDKNDFVTLSWDTNLLLVKKNIKICVQKTSQAIWVQSSQLWQDLAISLEYFRQSALACPFD
jgi:hypothetical protein